MPALSRDIIREIALRLDLKDLFSLCPVYTFLCSDEHFWQIRYYQDIGRPEEPISSWKEAYRRAFNNLYVLGTNTFSELGVSRERITSLLKVPGIKVRDASMGWAYSIIVDFWGNVWATGYNRYGAMGLEYERTYHRYTLVPGIKAKRVVCGHGHSLLIDLEDNVLVCGDNTHGELGLGIEIDKKLTFTPLGMKAKMIAAGGSHSLVVDLEGKVWVFGSNRYGQLTIPGGNQFRPTQLSWITGEVKGIYAGYTETGIVDGSGLVMFGELVERLFHSYTKVFPVGQSVSFGHTHIVILDTDGKIWVIGSNLAGQLGFANLRMTRQLMHIPRMRGKMVSAGYAHTAIIDLEDNFSILGRIASNVANWKMHMKAKDVSSRGDSVLVIGRV